MTEDTAAAGPCPSIPGFEVIGELGRGGMGVVYLARQAGLNRLVALKMILAAEYSRPHDRARFRSEAAAVARLAHPNLVQIHGSGEHQGRPYFFMEYVDGGRLADSLQGTPWDPRRAARLVETLARATHSAHERGVIHRDLTPSNVLLASDGEPKIVDFGLAKLTDGGTRRTASGDILGTAGYMAPEQATGQSKEVGPGADIYALGAILYELLTGRPPFVGASFLDALAQVVRDDPIAPSRLQPRLPRDLETISLKCLNKDPGRRYPTAAELADDLHRYLAGEPVRARPIGTIGRSARWVRRRPAVALLLALGAIGCRRRLCPRRPRRPPGANRAGHMLSERSRPRPPSGSRPRRRDGANDSSDSHTRASRRLAPRSCAAAMRGGRYRSRPAPARREPAIGTRGR